MAFCQWVGSRERFSVTPPPRGRHALEAFLGSGVRVVRRAVGAYRETVLTAFQEVEDQLVAVRLLAREETQQAAAVAAAERSLKLAENRYQGGITTYLEVVIAQSAALSNAVSY